MGVNVSDINVKEKKFKRNQSFFQILGLNVFYDLSKQNFHFSCTDAKYADEENIYTGAPNGKF